MFVEGYKEPTTHLAVVCRGRPVKVDHLSRMQKGKSTVRELVGCGLESVVRWCRAKVNIGGNRQLPIQLNY